MPINQTIWKISNGVEEIGKNKLDSELELENVLESNIEIINENWLIIGRQVRTFSNKYIDLLAIDVSGSIIILELKKEKTPREIIAQALDYASFVKGLSSSEISEIFENYKKKYINMGDSLNDLYFKKFGVLLDDDIVNNSHQIIIVATELDSSTERIVTYLNDSSVPLNAVFFKIFSINNEKYITRAWYIDPYETADIATQVISKNVKEPWNNEFYVSFGANENRNWEDAQKYGFISAAGGIWYTRTLNLLNIGDRVWVNIPRIGYVGVGRVIDTAHKADEVYFNGSNIYNLETKGKYNKDNISDDDKAEYIVKIEWIKTVELNNAVSEIGFFGNQNTVCKPLAQRWNHTIDRLKNIWKIT
jgi:hypothetical protein